MQTLLHYPWRGNVRELENVLERAVNMVGGDCIHPEHFPENVFPGQGNAIKESEEDGIICLNQLKPLPKMIEEMEKRAIEEALKKTNGSRKKAMGILGIGKTAFFEKMQKYGINL